MARIRANLRALLKALSWRQVIVIAVLFGVVVGIPLGYFLIRPTFLSCCPPLAPTSATITSPAAESEVPILATVQGTACTKGKELWLLVEAPDIKGYYPQSSGPIAVSSTDRKWSASAFIGTANPADVGKGYVVYAALVDQNSAGRAAIDHYFASGRASNSYKPLNPLPEGIELTSQVHVVRRPIHVTITTPAAGSEVPLSTIVQGTADYFLPDTRLWLLVKVEGITGYYPQNGPIDVGSNGAWSADAFIGGPDDAGKQFELHTALADQKGEATLEQYLKSSQASGKFLPIPLPNGVYLMSHVQVKRGRIYVKITTPAAESKVPRAVSVHGTASNIPQGEDLWVLVVPDADASHYYPQPGPAEVSSGGDWSGSAYVGKDTPDEVGKGFELVVVLTDQQGSATIRMHLDPLPPIPQPLPKGIQVLDQVHIVRK